MKKHETKARFGNPIMRIIKPSVDILNVYWETVRIYGPWVHILPRNPYLWPGIICHTSISSPYLSPTSSVINYIYVYIPYLSPIPRPRNKGEYRAMIWRHNILLSNMMTLKSGWEGHKDQRYANTPGQAGSDYRRFNNNWNFYFSHWDTILQAYPHTTYLPSGDGLPVFFLYPGSRSPLLIVIHPSISFRILPLKGS